MINITIDKEVWLVHTIASYLVQIDPVMCKL